MASATEAAKENRRDRQRQVYSIPVYEQSLEIHSLQAQRVMDRAFKRTVRALYSIDAILRIIGDDKEMDEVEEVNKKMVSDAREALRGETARLTKLMESNGITQLPGYTHPKSYTIQISSPQVAQFANLVKELDDLMKAIDALWILNVLDNKQRKEATFQWQQRMLRLGRRLVSIEMRARKAATSKGKGEEVEQAVPVEPGDEDHLETEEVPAASAASGGEPSADKEKPEDKKGARTRKRGTQEAATASA